MRTSRSPSTPTPAAEMCVSIGIEFESDPAHSAHDDGEAQGEVVALTALASRNDEECSGGETRTLNLAVNSRLLCH